MPTDADLEAMRTMVAAAVQSMGRELENLNRKAKEAAGPSGGIASLGSMFSGIASQLAGPVGVTAGIYAAAQSLRTFAENRVQLHMLSADLGFTEKNIRVMQEALADMGISSQAAEGYIGKLGAELKQLATMKVGSNLFVELNKMGEGEFAAKLLKVVESGDFDAAMKMLVRKYEHMSTAARTYLSVNVLGIPESVFQNYTEFEKHIGETFVGAYKHSENYLRNMNKFQRDLSNIWEQIKDIFITGVVGDDDIRTKGGMQWPQWLQDLIGKDNLEHPGQGFKGGFLGKAFTDPGALKEKTRPGDQPRATDFSGMRRADDMVKAEEDSSRTLIDIRDILQRLIQEGGGGQGGVESERGRAGLAARLGMRSPQGGGEGPSGQSKVSGGNINMKGGEKSPTGLYYPATSDKVAGVVGSDSASRGPGQHQGDDFMMPYGSPLYATKSGVVERYGTDNFGQKTMRIRHADGSSSSYLHMSERSVPEGSRVEAGQVIGASGTANRVPHLHFEMRDPKGNLLEPLRELGLRKDKSSTFDTKNDGSVKGSYFDDRRTASGLDASKVPGIALPSRDGLGKMHEVTLPDGRKIKLPQIDVGPAKWTGRGVDFSTPSLSQLGFDPTDKSFSVRRLDDEAEEARKSIDRTQSLQQRSDASMSATIDFKNMPSWVRSSVDSNGKFKDLKVTRSTPQAGRAGSDRSESNPWSYE